MTFLGATGMNGLNKDCFQRLHTSDVKQGWREVLWFTQVHSFWLMLNNYFRPLNMFMFALACPVIGRFGRRMTDEGCPSVGWRTPPHTLWSLLITLCRVPKVKGSRRFAVTNGTFETSGVNTGAVTFLQSLPARTLKRQLKHKQCRW